VKEDPRNDDPPNPDVRDPESPRAELPKWVFWKFESTRDEEIAEPVDREFVAQMEWPWPLQLLEADPAPVERFEPALKLGEWLAPSAVVEFAPGLDPPKECHCPEALPGLRDAAEPIALDGCPNECH
jgi:hypothetical protein